MSALARALDRPAVRAWLLSRAGVLALMAFAAWLQARHGFGYGHLRSGSTGFFVWDGDWYRDIAAHGYDETAGVRFFPLLPLAGRAFAPLGETAVGLVLVAVTNACALAFAEGIARLTEAELGDARAAGRAAWLALVNPASFVLVLAYAEAPAAALAVWCFLFLRRRRWLPAAGLAFLSGLVRPTGLLLALPAAVEAWRAPREGLARRAAAVVAGPAGFGAYLLWCGVALGDWRLPIEVQQSADLRAGIVSAPWPALGDSWDALLHNGPRHMTLRLVWLPLVLALLVVVARRLPLSYTAYAAVVLFLAVGTPRLASFERYSLAAFPLLMGAASLRTRWVRVALGFAFTGAVAYYAVLSFTNTYVP